MRAFKASGLRAMNRIGTVRLLLLCTVAAALAVWHNLRPTPHGYPGPLVGYARVIDGDTLDLSGQRIRLNGVDAPEATQTCDRQGQPYRCGEAATKALANLVQDTLVRCDSTGTDRYRRILARCRTVPGDISLGAWLVRNGYAVAYHQYSYEFIPEELVARAAGRGLWAGTFQMPWDYRHTRGVDDGQATLPHVTRPRF